MDFEDLTICFGGEIKHGINLHKLFKKAESEWNRSAGSCWSNNPDPATGRTCMRRFKHSGPHCCDYNRDGLARVWLEDCSMEINIKDLDVWNRPKAKLRPKINP